MSQAFISYSHADEKSLTRLHKHLSILTRDKTLTAWVDQEILPGSRLDNSIIPQLDASDLFLALISPDYLASNFCYEKEFQHALELEKFNKIRIVPIIIEPCDWKNTPFKDFLALPKDGTSVSEFTNANIAYLDIVNGIRKIIQKQPKEKIEVTKLDSSTERKLKVKRDFDVIERSKFTDETFLTIQDYFQKSCSELRAASDQLNTDFEKMSATAFTCTIVNKGSRQNRDAHITVQNSKGRRHSFGDINYVFERHAEDGSSNGSIRVDADDYNMYLLTDNFMGGNRDQKHNPKGAAEWLWNAFIKNAGIEYE